jgi:mannose-6-phosphate isomerase
MSTTETRPWGSFTVLEDTAHYKVKRLDVNPGQRLSYQNHQKRDEHWTVVMGVATVTLDGKTLKIPAGKAVNEELKVDQKLFAKNPDKLIKLKEKQMKEAVKILDFETAAILRDELEVLRDRLSNKADKSDK